jgi:hypothetical protein
VVADARVKDDALASIGIGLGVAVAGTVPAPEAPAEEMTASVEPVVAPAPEAIEAPVVTISLPESRTKDDVLVIVTPVASEEVAADEDDALPLAESPLVATAPSLPVDETAKDDDLSVAVGSGAEPVEPEMQGDAAPIEVEEAIVEPLPVDPAAPADPVAKDDGLATDLGGATVPIKGVPKLDDKAALNASVEPATVAN